MKTLFPSAVSLVMFLSVAAALPAQQTSGQQASGQALDVTRTVDWAAARIVVETGVPLDPAASNLIKAKADAETTLDQRLPEVLAQALGPLAVDSSHLLSDYLASDPALAGRLTDVALHAQRTDLFLTQDFSALRARYAVPFFGDQGIGVPFFPARATPVRRRLGDVTTRPYTGLLIFARGLLPLVGTSGTATAHPALFPRIWDEQMNLVLDRTMCFPESLSTWGMVGYSQTLDDPKADLRVGNLPLRLAARGVFGDHATDVVISLDGARQLLTLAENITMLQQGRIVIVYDSLE